GRIAALERCERQLVATGPADATITEALVAGSCVDVLAEHYAHTGRRDTPSLDVAVALMSASPDPRNREIVAWVNMLDDAGCATSRDCAAPVAVITCCADGKVHVEPMRWSVLDAACDRVERAFTAAARLAAGGEPHEQPGPHCRWCPDTVCPSRLDTSEPQEV